MRRLILRRSGQSRQLILQLRQLHLQLTFAGTRVPGEDIQDQLRPVDNSGWKFSFQVTQLRRGQVMVEQQQIGPGRGYHALNLLQFATADQRRRIRSRAPLNQRRSNLCTGAAGEFLKLRQ
jgi:hypothetical protein